MKRVHQSIVLAIMTGTIAFTSAQSTEIPSRGPIPFAAFDLDGNGVISAQEFNSVRAERMAQRAVQGRPMRHAPTAPSFTSFDTNGDRQLSQAELNAGQLTQRQKRYQAMSPGMGQGTGMGRNMPKFVEFDLNNDGVLLEDEFIEARGRRISERARQGYLMRGLSSAPPFSAVDQNSDGMVTPEEFTLAQSRHRQNRPRP